MDNKELNVDTIYKTYSTGLRNYLSRMVPELSTDDLVQDAFEKINRELKNFRGQSSIKTWVYKIAINTAYDRLRALSSKKHIHGKKIKSIDIQMLNSEKPGNKHYESVESRVIRKQMDSCVIDIVETLEDSYKSVLILKELENFKDKEIAQILQISLNAVKMRLHRARKKLKKELERQCRFYHDERNVFVCLPKSD